MKERVGGSNPAGGPVMAPQLALLIGSLADGSSGGYSDCCRAAF
jgi:hypothetical protein